MMIDDIYAIVMRNVKKIIVYEDPNARLRPTEARIWISIFQCCLLFF